MPRRLIIAGPNGARKTITPKTTTVKSDPMTKLITACLRRARADAVKTARMHGTPVVYLKNGKIVSERP